MLKKTLEEGKKKDLVFSRKRNTREVTLYDHIGTDNFIHHIKWLLLYLVIVV
jgi:hypothetical protein